MTRNLYLGADINRPLTAVDGLTGGAALVAFANANAGVWATVQRTDFPARALLLAREIATAQPDLVGLQEAALWRTGPLELPPSASFATPDATTVQYDFLAILLDDLAALGTPYTSVQVQQESDVEGPAFVGVPPNLSNARDVRLTMRDAILRPVGGKVAITASGSAQYAAKLTVHLGSAAFDFVRGYAWADARVGAKTFRFVTTHLESESSYLALVQAQQLLATAADQPGRSVVVVCDCNSDPLNHTTKATDPVPTPHSAAYDWVTAHGFTDEWLQWAPADQGWTSGLSETVDDPTPAGFDHRIDMVFAHLPDGGPMPVVSASVTGTRLGDRNAAGLWPSDHGGVVVQLRP
jgi:endonuclease/exonuclease/phosphatase family metal-dependent hydrolase